ncbi:MAG: hypothetical protein WBG71_07545 [Leeuwenhoekiella sp.]
METLASSVVFGGADDLWKSFQKKLNDFVNDKDNGGCPALKLSVFSLAISVVARNKKD